MIVLWSGGWSLETLVKCSVTESHLQPPVSSLVLDSFCVTPCTDKNGISSERPDKVMVDWVIGGQDQSEVKFRPGEGQRNLSENH